MENFVYRDKKKLRCGYTTGTCAALAAKAAVRRLLWGSWSGTEEIVTPKGVPVRTEILERSAGEGEDGGKWAQCAVKKDAGDDFDVTDGILVYARAEFLAGRKAQGDVPPDAPDKAEDFPWKIEIDGGEGVGRVTKPGLDQPVGAAAINSVPRRMIREAVTEVLEEWTEPAGIRITISVPAGRAAAEKTFNPILGITGGISILGTSGIVEPMSEEALVDTIRAHLRVLRAEGREKAVLVPGNMGENYLRRYLRERSGGLTGSVLKPEGETPAGGTRQELPDWEEDILASVVICSNFIGKSIDIAGELGFSRLLLAGHLGKLVKLGNGIMNTHSREGDGRMDTLLSCALSAGGELPLLKKIQGANTTNEAVSFLREAGILEETVRILLDRIGAHLRRRAMESLTIGVVLFGETGEVLGETKEAREILRDWNI